MAIYKFDDLLKKHNVTADQVTTYGSEESIKNDLLRMDNAKNTTPQNRLKEFGGDILGVGKDIISSSKKRANNMAESRQAYKEGEQGLLRTGLQQVGQLAGAGADAITAVGKGAVNLALSDKSEKAVTDVIGKFGAKVMANPEVQNIVNKYNSLSPEDKRDVDAIGGVVDLVSNFVGGKVVSKGADLAGTGIKATGTGIKNVANATGDVIKSNVDNVITKVTPESSTIMNRVARLTPKQAQTFESLAGKSHGQYLVETGNFGTPDKILANEATKFTKSLNDVDNALSKLPGVYKDGSIADALTELNKKALAESGSNIKAPYLSRVKELSNKFANEGLDMSEINEIKRLFERNVKLGYNKLNNAEKVAQATNIDNALRQWQVSQAKDLGFSNIADLNKQTQLSKFIIDNLGDQVVGKSGLNGVTLTDWIMLSGGDPTAVGGFLTKKFFSSKSVQSKIAQMLNKGNIKGQIKADIQPTAESIKRAVSPQGLEQLSAPTGGAKVQINKAINMPTRKQIEQGTEVVTRAKQLPQQSPKILLKKSLANSTTKNNDIATSISKAKASGQSFDEWVKDSMFSPVRDSVRRNEIRTELSKITQNKKANLLKENPNNPPLDKSTINIRAEDIRDGKRPYVLVEGNKIIDGHHTYRAYLQEGIEDIPVVTRSQLKAEWDRVGKTSLPKNTKLIRNKDGSVTYGSQKMSGDLSTSISKAKASGQSFDEWVKGQQQIFHGTKSDIGIEQLSSQSNSRGQYLGDGIYFTKYKEGADLYGGKTLEAIVDNSDFLDISKLKGVERTKEIGSFGTYKQYLKSNNLTDTAKNFDTWSKNQKSVSDKVLQMGYKGITDGQQHVIFDKSALKTRSQLKAEWEKIK